MPAVNLIPVNTAAGTYSVEFTVATGANPSFYLVGNAANVRVTDRDVIRIHRKCIAGYFTPIRDITGEDKGELWLGVGTFKAQVVQGTAGFERE